MKKLINLIKDFEKVSFWHNKSWKKNYKIFYFLPAFGLEWDTQCRPIVEDGEIMLDGSRELTFYIDWLIFSGGMCFEFGWTVINPKDFEIKPLSEEDRKEIDEMFENSLK